jgi:hypothetical protein
MTRFTPHLNFYKIIKVKGEIVVRMMEYIESLTYDTYSKTEKKNVTRNSFSIIRLEATNTGTNIWLEGFGQMREARFEALKNFAASTEELLNERKRAEVHG